MVVLGQHLDEQFKQVTQEPIGPAKNLMVRVPEPIMALEDCAIGIDKGNLIVSTVGLFSYHI